MEFCCPSPENTIIQPDNMALRHRRRLRLLMYGQVIVFAAKMVLFGALSAFFQLINVWIIYMAWATMHFCSTLFILIITGIDLLMIMISFGQL